MSCHQRLGLAVGIVLICLVLRRPLEAHPLTHVLVQLPALVGAGMLIAPCCRGLVQGRWNAGGIACLILAGGCFAVWMLPRMIDGAIADERIEVLKFVTLPLLGGLPLACGVMRAHPVLVAWLKAHAISMCGVLAFLYTHAPVRLCNSYTWEAQYTLGIGFLFAGLALTLLWVLPLFIQKTAVTPAVPAQSATASAARMARGVCYPHASPSQG